MCVVEKLIINAKFPFSQNIQKEWVRIGKNKIWNLKKKI